MRFVFLCLLAACSKNDQPPEPQSNVHGVRIPAQPQRQLPTPSTDIPEWLPIANLDGAPAKPTAWKADGRPTLVVFSASWCPGCTASALADRLLVRDHGKHFQIGVALQESDDAFVGSSYAKALSGVPVWSEASTKKMTDACRPSMIPSACLYNNGKALWFGGASEASPVLEAHRAGKLADWLAAADTRAEAAQLALKEALRDPAKIPEALSLMHGRADHENSVAWNLVDRDDPSPNAVALAVALSRDAVASDGGIDFAHLDTYALALAKAGRVADAAYVGARVLEVCAAVQGKCSEEKQRAKEFIERAKARTL